MRGDIVGKPKIRNHHDGIRTHLSRPPFQKKDMPFSRKDVLQGLSAETAKAISELGDNGWELVAALPYSSGSLGLSTFASTDAALGLFKRAKA